MTIDALEPAWSGEMERAGIAPSLSGYIGRSSIYNCPGAPAVRGPDVYAKPKIERQKMTSLPADLEFGILDRLKRGESYNVIARALNVTRDTARKVGRWHHITRERIAGTNVVITRTA
jgi:hypothetical protein